MANKSVVPILIIVTAVMAGGLDWSNTTIPLRPILIFLFMLVIPGLAFTRLFHFKDLLVEMVLAVALSLVTSTALAELMLFTHTWSPNTGLGVLIELSLLGASLQIIQSFHVLPNKEV
jgi:uncharacterized membrane protein